MTLGEYLFRALVYLLAFAGTGLTIFGGVRVVEIVQSETSRRGQTSDNEP